MSELKEVRELMVGLKHVAVCIAKVAKDGQVNAIDTVHLMELLSKQSDLIAAVQGLAEIPSELKGIELDQMGALILEILQAVKAVKAEIA